MIGLQTKLIALAGIALLAAAAWWYVSSLQGEVRELTAANTIISQKLKDQNDAIDLLKKDADVRLAAGEAAVKLAKEEAAKVKGKATIIYRTKPSDPKDVCKSALDLVNGAAK